MDWRCAQLLGGLCRRGWQLRITGFMCRMITQYCMIYHQKCNSVRNNGRIENLTGPNRERGRDELNRSGMYRVFRYNIEQRSSERHELLQHFRCTTVCAENLGDLIEQQQLEHRRILGSSEPGRPCKSCSRTSQSWPWACAGRSRCGRRRRAR